MLLSIIGKADAAGIQHRCAAGIPGAVFAVAHQGIAPAGKLHTDLVGSAGVQPDFYQCRVAFAQPRKRKPCRLYADTLPFDNKHLVLAAVFKKKVLPVAAFRYCAMHERDIFFGYFVFLYLPGKLRRSSLCPGVDHDAAYTFVQPVQNKDLTAQLLF